MESGRYLLDLGCWKRANPCVNPSEVAKLARQICQILLLSWYPWKRKYRVHELAGQTPTLEPVAELQYSSPGFGKCWIHVRNTYLATRFSLLNPLYGQRTHLFARINIAKSNDLHHDWLTLRQHIFCNCIGHTTMVEKSTCGGKDSMPDAGEMGVNDEIVVPES